MADDERGLPQDGATLPAGVRGLGTPAGVHAFHQSRVVAVVLKQGHNRGRRRRDGRGGRGGWR